MRELAEAIGMSVGSVYYYVGSKQDILYLIINEAVSRPQGWVEDIKARLRTSPASQVLTDSISMYYTTIDQRHTLTLFSYQETRNLDSKAQQLIMDAAAQDIEAYALILRKGIETGEFKLHNVLLMSHNIVVLGHMWAIRWWYLSRACTLEEYILEQTGLILSRITNK
jgi:AcrR family transcriptional regulator